MRRRIAAFAAACLTLALAADTAIIEPKDLAAQLRGKGEKPALFYIGFAVLYRKHIPGAVFAGPTSRAEGLAAFKAAVEKLPRDREVVIYCGCCPWDVCPNVQPATDLLREMGFKRTKVLRIENNFAADWIDHGYPIEEKADAK